MIIVFDVVVLIVLMWLVFSVLTLGKYLKKNQGHIADLFQREIDKLSKEQA